MKTPYRVVRFIAVIVLCVAVLVPAVAYVALSVTPVQRRIAREAEVRLSRLLDADVRRSLFRSEIPIYTKVRDAVPTLFGYSGQAANCLIADGCHLFGKAENSVIFREVDIEEGAEVRDSIVMQGSRIGAGASIRYCILDKNVTIRPGTKLLGSKDHPLVVDKGDTV